MFWEKIIFKKVQKSLAQSGEILIVAPVSSERGRFLLMGDGV
jgi:hypothetical protein